ncbi:MAG: hypothetical protein ABIJ41_02810 [Candidatus Omnitrophota bacterium]
MKEKTHRRQLFKVSKFQAPILNLIIGLALITLIMMTTNIAFLSYDITNVVANPERTTAALKATIILSLIILPLVLLLGIIWACNLSNKIIGPFERVIREMDEVLSTGNKKHIVVRKGDQLAQEVIKRINTLIERMS